MAQTIINIPMDEKLKHDFDVVCAEIGLTTTAAFTVFAQTVTQKRVMPFKIPTDGLPDEITLASEKSLAKEWLLPEEDEAWANL
jgi:DNA-damage-inducible protein J